MADQDEIVLGWFCGLAGLLLWKALLSISQTAQILPKPWDLSKCMCVCVCVRVCAGRLHRDVYESVCKGMKGLLWSFHTQRREGWICFHHGPSNPWPQPRDQQVAQPHWIPSFKIPLDWTQVLWTSNLYYAFPFNLTHLFHIFTDISVPNVLLL